MDGEPIEQCELMLPFFHPSLTFPTLTPLRTVCDPPPTLSLSFPLPHICAQSLVEYFGTLSKEWALECLKELLVVNPQVQGGGGG